MTQHIPRRVAIWVDRRVAILATFSGDQLDTEGKLYSSVEPHTRGEGWSRHHIEAHRHALLQHYYDEIVHHLGPVDEILILGPGQGKHELIQRIERHKGLRGKVVAVHSADKMTEAELIAMAAEFFDASS